MVEKIAEIEVEMGINDREYTNATKRATDATDKLDKKAKDLSSDIQKAGDKAKNAGKNFDEMGKQAEKAGAQFSNLNTKITNFQGALSSFGGGLLGGGIAGLAMGGLGMIAGAVEQRSAVMQSMGLAAGGDPTMLAAIDKLYRETNRKTTLESPQVGNIATQVAKRFGFLSPADQSQFAAQISTLGETGEDTGLILRSMEKVMKAYGLTDASDTLNRLNYVANRSSNTVGETIASVAALSPESARQGISFDELQRFVLSGSRIYGETATESASRVARGLGRMQMPSSEADKRILSSYPKNEWMWRMEYPTAWDRGQLGTLEVGTGRYADGLSQYKREGDLIAKDLGEGISSWLGSQLPNFLANLKTVSEYPYAERRREMSGWSMVGRADRSIQVTQIFNFKGDFAPSIDGVHAAKKAAASIARR